MPHRIDDGGRVFHLELTGGTARRLLDEVLAVVKARPDLWAWDWIVYTPVLPEDASIDQIAQLAQLYADAAKAEVLTIFVSHDPSLHLWARVMDFQFRPRKHVVVATLQAAEARLERERSTRR